MLTQIILFFFRTSKFLQNKKYGEKCGTGLHFASFFDVFNFFLCKENLNFWNPKIARFLPLLLHLICCDISFWLKHMKKILPHIDRLLEGGCGQWDAVFWACLYLGRCGKQQGEALLKQSKVGRGQGNNVVRWQVCTEPGQVPSLVHDLLRTMQSSNEE